LPKCPARSFHNAAEHIPEALLPALGPIVEQIGSLTRRIRQYDRELEAIAKESYPETELLRQLEGIGPLSALTFVLSVEDPHRFEKSRSVGAYLGLVPARDQSGDSDPQKRISKEGDEMLSVSSWSVAPTTSLDPSDRTRTSDATGRRWPPAEARTPRSERWWPWQGSSLCYCTVCGRAGRSTKHYVRPTAREARRPKGKAEPKQN
jgi:Transposase IS116/IS110/IS902 family